MKIKRLRIAGFGPYKTEQTIDFERFDADGIFLISGKTGAGKSSILDAICFALYNKIPRFEGTEQQLRSDYCEPEDPTFVELEFSLHDRDYRIFRSPQYDRAKKNGTGTTTAAPTAELSRRVGDVWQGVESKPKAVGIELANILPLKEDQFLQVILLAQNRFQRFLLAKTDDRRAVLRTLFGTARFERLDAALVLRRKDQDAALAAVQRNILERAAAVAAQLHRSDVPTAPDLDWFEGCLAELEEDLRVARERADAATADLAVANATEAALAEIDRLQQRRSAARSAHDALDSTQTRIEEHQVELIGAARAARVWPQIRGRRQSGEARAAAESVETDARIRWQEYRPERSGDDTTAAVPLTAAIDELLRRLGSLDDALADEEQLPALDAELTALAKELSTHRDRLIEAEGLVNALPTQIEGIRVHHDATVLSAAREPEEVSRLAAVELALAAAESVDSCERDLRAIIMAESVASRENTAAAAEYEALLARRFSGYAGELATQLVDGKDCPVCGSASHPRPSPGEGDPVSERQILSARERIDSTNRALDIAAARVPVAVAARTEALNAAGNKSVDELLSERDAALAARDDARGAGARVGALAAELDARRGDLERLSAEVVELRGVRDAAATQHAQLSSKRAVLAAQVSTRRGDFPTVIAQVERLRLELAAARAFEEALSRSREHQNLYDVAVAAVAHQLGEEGFATEDMAIAARLSEAEAASRNAEVRAHDDARAAARATLAETALAGLAEEPVDRHPAINAVAAAREARDAALGLRSSLEERQEQLGIHVDGVRTHFAASAELLETHALVRGLADVVHGDEPNTKRMRLETYVLAAQLEQIVAAANIRLRTMTSGRYTLEHSDAAEFGGAKSGLALVIRDAHTGRARATASLSGGETFLASLALALGLAEVVTGQAGGVTLDTLFVDEGFGSLDSETLEIAMSTLEGLRAGGRTIGLISHVDSMTEQIPAALRIVVTDRGHSEIAAH